MRNLIHLLCCLGALSACNYDDAVGDTRDGGTGASSGAGGSPSGGGTTGRTSSSAASSGSTTVSNSLPSSSTGTGTGGGPYGVASATEYHTCTSSQSCTAPEQCTPAVDGLMLCLIPCHTLFDCHDDELCQGGSCYPNICGPSVTANPASYDGSCVTGDGDAGVCVPGTDPVTGMATGVCFTAGPLATGASCSANPSQLWSVLHSGLCAPPALCVPSVNLCTPACDPSGSLGVAACPGSLTCTPVPGYEDAYLGLCL